MSAMNVLFFIRRNGANVDVEAPIYMRITIDEERFEKDVCFRQIGRSMAGMDLDQSEENTRC